MNEKDTTCKHSIKIYCQRDKLIMFDFESFAVIIEYNLHENKDSFQVYFADDCSIIEICGLRAKKTFEIVEISEGDFQEIKEVFSRWQTVHETKLWTLLQKNFPSNINSYLGH